MKRSLTSKMWLMACLLLATMLQMIPYMVSAQQKTTGVTGVVQDAKGKPIAGVTVLAKNTKTNFSAGIQTDANGIFQFPKLPAGGPYSFTLSSIGYETQTLAGYTIKADALISLVAKMVESTAALEDIVVVGYGSRKKTDVTGAIASISGDKLRAVPTTNITTALQGRVAGIVVAPNSFRPGAGASIVVRGSRSLSTSNGPLYVVDGIPVSYTIDDINPNDIETIDVLKDASSTAIYGVRGANGVIQITTKKAKAGKTRVDYTGNTSYDNILKHVPVFNAVQLADAWRQAYFADRLYNFAQSTSSPNNYFPNAAADVRLFGGNTGNAMWDFIKDAYQFTTFDRATNTYIAAKRATTAEERALMANLGLAVLTEVDAYDPSKIKGFDWQNAAIRTGITNNHAISVSIGTEKIKSNFNGAYFKQTGIEFGQDYTRYSIGNNTEFKPSKSITFGNSFSFTNSVQNVGTSLYTNASSMLPFTKPYDSAGNFLLYPNGDQQIVNGLGDAGTVLNEVKVNRLIGNVYAEIMLFKGLRYKTVFGLDYRNSRNGTFNGSKSSVRQGNAANASYTINNGSSWVYDNMLLYDTKIKGDHSINVTLLQELQSLNRNDALTLSAQNLIFEEQKWYSLQQNSLAIVTGSGSYSAQQYLSYMGRLEYGYKNKYLLTVSNRYDNSSVLAIGNQGAFFPSAAFAWRMENENFFKSQNIFSSAKLRLGIGRVGNASVDPYQTSGPLSAANYNWANGNAAIGQAPRTFRTPNLTWEKTTTRNIGLDFSLLKNRISASIDIYSTTTKDILQEQTINGTNGVQRILVNRGQTENKGIDITISSINISTKGGFTWTTDIVFSKNKEKIVDIDGSGNSNLANLWILGQPINVYYNYISDGIYQYGDTAKGGYLKDYLWNKGTNAANTAYRPGKIRVRDLNGDTLINASDKVVLGTHNPDWTAGITNTFTYKNFELNFNVYIRQGGMYRVPRPGFVGRYQSFEANYWTPTNPSNEYQQPTRTSDIPLYWEALGYRNASFVKVRNISLSYRVPETLLSKIKVSSLSFYVNAVNPFLFHKHSKYDPETIQYRESFTATTANTTPNSYSFRSFVFGAKLGF
jgi:TonB-linked SusC/RagA family outer membrane protein